MINEKYVKIGQVFQGSPKTTGSIQKITLEITNIQTLKDGREIVTVKVLDKNWHGNKTAHCDKTYFKHLAILPQ